LPSLQICTECGTALDGLGPAWFARGRAGVYCASCRRLLGLLNAGELNAEARMTAELMLRTPIASLAQPRWQKETAAGLRRLLVQRIEEHIERKLVTAPIMEAA
jgi:DNA repair protein RecO (recombination protein O)